MAAGQGTGGAVTAAEIPNLGYIVLRGRSDDVGFLAAVASVIGAPPPLEPRAVLRCQAGVLLWQSPDEWWVVCPRADRDRLMAALTNALQGSFAQVVDSSGGFTALHLRGPASVTVLRHLTPYDFDGLGPEQCVATVVGKAGFTVLRVPEGVTLVFRRSFALYLWQLIERAAGPYGLAVESTNKVHDGLLSTLLAPCGRAVVNARADTIAA